MKTLVRAEVIKFFVPTLKSLFKRVGATLLTPGLVTIAFLVAVRLLISDFFSIAIASLLGVFICALLNANIDSTSDAKVLQSQSLSSRSVESAACKHESRKTQQP
jgi:hypothetical protein